VFVSMPRAARNEVALCLFFVKEGAREDSVASNIYSFQFRGIARKTGGFPSVQCLPSSASGDCVWLGLLPSFHVAASPNTDLNSRHFLPVLG